MGKGRLSAMHEELELKLAVTPDDLRRLRRDPLIRSLAHSRARTKQLHTTYFDTPSLELRRRGMALRVRRVGNRRVQTLKVPGDGESGLQHYREYETEIAADTPDIERIETEEGNLHLFWGPVPEDVEVIIVYRQVGDEDPRTIAQLVSGEQDYIDEDVEADVEYRYFLRVTDERENLSPPGKDLAARLEE